MLCVCCVQRVVEGSVVGSAGRVGGYNVLAILSMADMVCLACMQKLWNPEKCWVCMVCMVYMVYGLYDTLEFKLCCEILLLLNMVDMDRWKTVERAMLSTLFI